MAGLQKTLTLRVAALPVRRALCESRQFSIGLAGQRPIPILATSLSPSVIWSTRVQNHRRSFQTSAACLKKGGGSKTSRREEEDANTNAAHAKGAAVDDPFDFSELSESIKSAHTALKEGLSKLRAGGRFNPEVIDNLRVHLDKNGKETIRLGDLAQCVPRGRVLNVMAGEQDHVKSIASAIQISNLNLTPQTDTQNPLQLNIQLPPPTTESRQQAVKTAVDLAEKANTAVRNARGAQQKRHRAMALKKTARPDDLKKASDRWEKVVGDGAAEVKRILDSAKKVLESG